MHIKSKKYNYKIGSDKKMGFIYKPVDAAGTIIASLLLSIMLISCAADKADKHETLNSEYIQHVKVFNEEDRFAAWPANNGAWTWGDEILVGFVEADYMGEAGFHTYDQNTARHKYARSTDGGLTWNIEDAFEQGHTGWGYDHDLDQNEADLPVKLTVPINDFLNPDFIMTFVRHNNANGPTHFYYSENRGNQWEGPFQFPNLNTPGVANRNDYIVDGEQELTVFITTAKENGEEGRVATVRTENGGVDWEFISWIGSEHEGFDIMPSTVRLSSTDLFTVIRTRDANPTRDYLKAYRSSDNGETWRRLKDPVADTGQYGAPPSLLQLDDGRLALAYVYRSDFGSRICMRISSDEGETWSHEIPIRAGDGATADVGYPRMVKGQDNNLVVMYYWNHAGDKNADPDRYIAASLVDTDFFTEIGL
ncbi:MAG: sialidase family protein [Balneolales bacterium]